MTAMQRRAGTFLLAAGGLLGLLLMLLFPGVPWAAAEAPDGADSCTVSHLALDPSNQTLTNPNKESRGAFGPRVEDRGEVDVKAELDERRTCGTDNQFDTALTAAHYAEWSHHGLTSIVVGETTAEIDAFAAKIKTDSDLYGKVMVELKKLEDDSAYSEEAVPAGVWSMYMATLENGDVSIRADVVSYNGTAAVFTHPSGAVVKYRLDCGFQPVRESGFPGLDPLPPAPPVPPVPPTPECEGKFCGPTPEEDGWTPRGTDNNVTDGQESARQQESGETRGNAVDDQVAPDTTDHSVTPDTKPSGDGGPVAPDATSGGDNQSTSEVDTENTNQDTGGTDGDTCVPDPIAGISC